MARGSFYSIIHENTTFNSDVILLALDNWYNVRLQSLVGQLVHTNKRAKKTKTNPVQSKALQQSFLKRGRIVTSSVNINILFTEERLGKKKG